MIVLVVLHQFEFKENEEKLLFCYSVRYLDVPSLFIIEFRPRFPRPIGGPIEAHENLVVYQLRNNTVGPTQICRRSIHTHARTHIHVHIEV